MSQQNQPNVNAKVYLVFLDTGMVDNLSFKSVNMQNKHGSSIYMIAQLLSEEVYWKQ